MLALFILLIMTLGIVGWVFGIVEYFVFGADIMYALFFVVVGGQLVKVAYAICESEDLDKKHESIMAAIKQVKNRF